jgi:hypothetical protein
MLSVNKTKYHRYDNNSFPNQDDMAVINKVKELNTKMGKASNLQEYLNIVDEISKHESEIEGFYKKNENEITDDKNLLLVFKTFEESKTNLKILMSNEVHNLLDRGKKLDDILIDTDSMLYEHKELQSKYKTSENKSIIYSSRKFLYKASRHPFQSISAIFQRLCCAPFCCLFKKDHEDDHQESVQNYYLDCE